MGSPTSNPRISIQLLPAALIAAFAERRDLIVGQTGSGGSAVDGALNQNVQALTTAQIKALFGSNSELTYRILAFKSPNGGYSPLDVIAKSPSSAPAAVAATATIVFAGTATSNGSINFGIVDKNQFDVTVNGISGDTATILGDALVAAINQLTDPPFSAVNALGTVTITASDGGTIGNFYGIDIIGNIPGVTVTLTGFSGGLNDPTLTTILDPIDGIRYTGVSWPEFWSSNLSIITNELDARFNAANNILDGVAFHGHTDTFANNKTFVASLNSQSLVVGGNNKVTSTTHTGPEILIPPDWVLAEFMAIRSRRLTTDAPIADFIISTSGVLDSFGGPSLASLPYFNTPLANTPITQPTDLFSSQEQVELEESGFTTYGVNSALNGMIMAPTVTTWTTDGGGNPNDSFRFLNFVETGSVCREIFFRVLKSVYSQSRLTEGTLIPGRSMANAESIKAQLLSIYKLLSGLALTQAGSEAETYFANNTTVTVSLSERKVTISGPLPIVTQLGEINYALQLDFTVGDTGAEITV